jgi:predicted RNA-binding Zn-ribbon protein involved in translation (DUF1610 family)
VTMSRPNPVPLPHVPSGAGLLQAFFQPVTERRRPVKSGRYPTFFNFTLGPASLLLGERSRSVVQREKERSEKSIYKSIIHLYFQWLTTITYFKNAPEKTMKKVKEDDSTLREPANDRIETKQITTQGQSNHTSTKSHNGPTGTPTDFVYPPAVPSSPGMDLTAHFAVEPLNTMPTDAIPTRGCLDYASPVALLPRLYRSPDGTGMAVLEPQDIRRLDPTAGPDQVSEFREVVVQRETQVKFRGDSRQREELRLTMSTDRIFVENCAVLSASQVNSDVPRSDEFPWKSAPVTFTQTCRSCGNAVEFHFKAARTRQGKRFLCPQCGRPVQYLYRPPQAVATDWRCKECHRLVYRSQYVEKPTVNKLAGLGLLGFGGSE